MPNLPKPRRMPLARRLPLALATVLATGVPASPPSVADDTPGVTSRLVVEGLTAPIALESIPDGSGRKLILDQSGLVHLLTSDGRLAPAPFLDLRDRLLALQTDFEERGLLGMAVHPGFESNGRLFVSYSAPLDADAPEGWNHTRIVSEFTLDAENAEAMDPSSERVLLRQPWPSRKHNGGALAFGPDGLLYIGFGDGGGIHGVGPTVLYDAFSVPRGHAHWDSFAQDVHTLFGKILRIDVDHGYPGYAVPDDNPFVARPGRGEIYAWGFRNPYRIAFDADGSGDFYVTAVAETLWEAVYRIDAPGNYGWPLREATHCFDRFAPLSPPASCAGTERDEHGHAIVDPVLEYPNMSVQREGSTVTASGIGTAVVGAVMVRNEALEALRGKLLFADWSHDFREPSGQLFVATPPISVPDKGGSTGEGAVEDDAGVPRRDLWPFEKIAQLDTRIVSLSEDADGTIYVLTNEELGPYGETGKVFRLEPTRP